MLKLVTFDLDDTLWAVAPVMQRANQALYAWLAEHAPRFTARYAPEDLALLRERILAQHPEWMHSVTAIRQGVLRLGLGEVGYPPERTEALAAQAFAVFLEARNQVELFCHAREMLADLRAHYQLAALSNGNADVERVGLGDYFHFALSADGVGRAKPDALMFEQALQLAGVDAVQALHVGDHPEHDIQGAQKAGLHTLWVNFSGAPWRAGEPPTLEVRSLEEVPAAVAELARRLRVR